MSLSSIDNKGLLSNLQRIIDNLPKTIDQGIADAAEQGAELARTETFYTPRTNALKEATKAQDLGFMQKGIIADKYYANWVNSGNGPAGSKIFPKQAKALRFEIDGQVFYRKWVMASEPKPFWDNMIKWEKNNYEKILSKHILQMIENK